MFRRHPRESRRQAVGRHGLCPGAQFGSRGSAKSYSHCSFGRSTTHSLSGPSSFRGSSSGLERSFAGPGFSPGLSCRFLHRIVLLFLQSASSLHHLRGPTETRQLGATTLLMVWSRLAGLVLFWMPKNFTYAPRTSHRKNDC